MAKKKSAIDRAIEQLEADKAALDGQAAVLQAAIERLKAQVQQQLVKARSKQGVGTA
jgi:prefoldin subunit 5